MELIAEHFQGSVVDWLLETNHTPDRMRLSFSRLEGLVNKTV
jgi:hypothetical protein